VKLRICCIGKARLPYARAGIDEYLGRLQRWTKTDIVTAKNGTSGMESDELLRLSEGSYRIALDPRGKLITTEDLAARIQEMENRSVQQVSLLIGGADGHTEALRKASDFVWSLSPLTLQHELALVVALEQIYRAHSLLRGEPYHRA
jgi:23S rRNA (pseudouridine1915-N3)-methyltransferase